MKIVNLQLNDKVFRGGIEVGITSILISFKKPQYSLTFGSLDDTGMKATTWMSSDIEIGDKLIISFDDATEVSNPIDTVDYNDISKIDDFRLKSYYQLRDELIKDGILLEE